MTLGVSNLKRRIFEDRRFLQIITSYDGKSINSEIFCNSKQQSVISSLDVHT